MANLIEKDLSYRINGVLFGVYNTLGGGYQEKYYQRAIAKEFEKQKILFKEQLFVPFDFHGESIGRYFLDFLVENRVVLEIKSSPQLYPKDIKQVLAYLKRSGLELGILANFRRSGLEIKRIVRGR